jgi:hypothetical protein
MFKAGWLEMPNIADSLLNIIEQLVSDQLLIVDATDLLRELLQQDSLAIQDLIELISKQLLSDQALVADTLQPLIQEQITSDSLTIIDLLEKFVIYARFLKRQNLLT